MLEFSAMKAFLSYPPSEQEFGRSLRAALGKRGISVRSSNELTPGSSWWDWIEEAVQGSEALVLLVFDRQLASQWQDLEWRAVLRAAWADPTHKRLVPVLMGETQLPGALTRWQALRFPRDVAPDLVADRLEQVLQAPWTGMLELPASAKKKLRRRLQQVGRWAAVAS